MKLTQVIFLALAVAAFVIGVHRTVVEGFAQNYWLFMLSIVFLMLFRYQKPKHG